MDEVIQRDFMYSCLYVFGLPRWLSGKKSICQADVHSIPRLGRSPVEGNGNHSSILA